MKNQSKSPEDHSINIRKPNFNLEKDLGHDSVSYTHLTLPTILLV